ncbi:MAG: ABC transporter permease subunit [Oscillospiraceae bacterium]|nr:ABC transporter permease subunit [Oscillospiraceae bacterium]
MIRFFIKRVIMLIPVIIAVSFIVYTLLDLAPGDPLDAWDLSNMTEAGIAELRLELGIDDPLIVRYGRYMFRLVQGDLGVGDRSRISVWYTFMTRLPNTLILTFATFVIGVTISIPLGIFAARRAGKISDNLATAFTMIGMSMPGFWLGTLLILLFAYQLGWFPAGGFREGFRSIVLPAVCAALILVASAARQTRSSMLEVLKADYLRTARAKGVPESIVIRKHALGNALIPIVTIIGLGLGISIAGTAVIEAVFAWPGIGRFVVESVAIRDVNSTTGAVILTTILYVFVQLLVDLAYALIDPRIKAQYINSAKRNKQKKKTKKATEGSVLVAGKERVKGSALAAKRDENVVFVSQQFNRFAEEPKEEAPDEAPAKSFATRSRKDIESDNISKANLAEGELVSKQYRKRSQMGEIFHHILRNKGAVIGLLIIAIMVSFLIASLFIPFEAVTAASVPDRFSPPSWQFPFGTDGMGRNQFIRVIYATRFSLPIGFGATTVAAIIGIALGAIAAYYEGSLTDEVIMRISDILASIPGILLGMVIITTLGRSLENLIIAVGVSIIPQFIRMARASILSIKGSEYVEAARAIGLPSGRIIFTQVLPNGLSPIIVLYTSLLGITILVSASLSFLGFGIPVPNPEWGALVAAGRDNIRNAPWLTTFPGLFIMVTVMAFNLLGDGLRCAGS